MIICPPAPANALDPNDRIPHPGFGMTVLYRNGREVWSDVFGSTFDSGATVAELTEWCPVSRGVGWKLKVVGPMAVLTYRLRDGFWVLTEHEMGFA